MNIILPILEWTDDDVREFIESHGIRCHPLYYDEYGKFHVERRLGCLGCPLRADRGLSDFKAYPKLVRCWIKAGHKWFDRPGVRSTGTGCRNKFGDVYNLFVHNIFFSSYENYWLAVHGGLFGYTIDCKAVLEDYFKIDLTI